MNPLARLLAAVAAACSMRRSGREVTRESLYRSLNGLGSLDVGGYVVNFSPENRHG